MESRNIVLDRPNKEALKYLEEWLKERGLDIEDEEFKETNDNN